MPETGSRMTPGVVSLNKDWISASVKGLSEPLPVPVTVRPIVPAAEAVITAVPDFAPVFLSIRLPCVIVIGQL